MVLFRTIFAVAGYHLAPGPQVRDLTATSETEAGFNQLVLWLTGLGFVIGSSCGLVLRRVYVGRLHGK